MIRPYNINAQSHTASFMCDTHYGSVDELNLNVATNYSTDNTTIVVYGSNLSPACDCVTCFPTQNGNADAQALAAAKTE